MALIKIHVPDDDCKECNYLIERQRDYYSYVTERYCSIFRANIEGYNKCCPCNALSEKEGKCDDSETGKKI
jgi:hypothetical protein